MSDSINSNSYRINEKDVSAEDFRSEILAVDLKKGHYHSLQGAAVPIWRLLVDGHQVETIARWLAPIYGRAPEAMCLEVGTFVLLLEENQLIIPNPTAGAPEEATPPEWLADLAPTYQTPVLDTYTEMQDLLMLDPIHDIDVEAGWPHLPKAPDDQV